MSSRHFLTIFSTIAFSATVPAAEITLLNVSYDPTRELYTDINTAFANSWGKTSGNHVKINQSHGGSGKQARAVIDGLSADVVTLALAYDIDAIAQKGKLITTDWQNRLPHRSAPFTSTIVFLVRQGNPKHITDWSDLTRSGISVITSNPITSGGARWTYLAAWGWALKAYNNDTKKTEDFIADLYKHVPVLDSGARGSTTTFIERGLGDVLLTWENEAHLAIRGDNATRYTIVIPSVSILAEPPVAVVDKVVDKKDTRAAAEAYVQFLYTPEAQEIAAKNHYRPTDPEIAKKYQNQFPSVSLFTIEEVFGGWTKAQHTHFSEGGTYDRLSQR